MKKNINKVNLNNFASEISALSAQNISIDHIHPSTEGRYYYIQAPKPGAPMLLHHYRGTFFIDIHPDDLADICSGKVTAHEYITSANWQVGYYWGGGSMVTGGYYQPLDIIGRRNEVQRYLKILSCRGYCHSCGSMPTEKNCAACSVEKCPFSSFKKGKWKAEMPEHDPRCDLFKALLERFEKENPGYTLRGFLCGGIPDGEIWLSPNGRYTEGEPLAFTVYVSESVIRALMMHETEPESWTEYAKSFEFRIYKRLEEQSYEANNETLEKAFEGLDYTKKAKNEPEDDIYEEKVPPLLMRMANFLKKRF